MVQYMTYSEYKKDLDAEMERSAEGFVRIGYLLKVARDTDILAESGYKTVSEFAQAEYGIDKTQASRFMRINDRFSEGGYSDSLLPGYRGFGHAKLTLMLSLPDEINAELTADYTKTEIQEIKEAVDAEQKDTDIELMLEERQPVRAEGIPEDLAGFAHAACRENTGLYMELWDCIHGDGSISAMEVLAGDGQQTYIARIPGKGRFTLFIQDGRDAAFCSIRDPQEKQFFPAGMVEKAFLGTVPEAGNVKEAYEKHYGMPWPEDREDAPAQQGKKAGKKKRVVKTEPKKTEKTEPEKTEPENTSPEEEQTPGQMDVHDFTPEKIPEEETEVLPPETGAGEQPEGSSPEESTAGYRTAEGTEKENRGRALSCLENAAVHLKNWRQADSMPRSVLDDAARQAEMGLAILKALQGQKNG